MCCEAWSYAIPPPCDNLGAVVQVHSTETLEVEFVRASGQTQALVTVRMPTCGRSKTAIWWRCARSCPRLAALPKYMLGAYRRSNTLTTF